LVLSDCDTIFYFVTYYVFLLWSRDDLDIEELGGVLSDVRNDMCVNKNILWNRCSTGPDRSILTKGRR